MHGPPVTVGDPPQHGKDRFFGIIGGKLTLPGSRRAAQLPDLQRSLPERVFHISGRRIAKLEKVLVKRQLLIFLGNDTLQRPEQSLPVCRADIAGNNGGKAILFAACPRRRFCREIFEIANQDRHVTVRQWIARHDVIEGLPGGVNPETHRFGKSLPRIRRALKDGLGINDPPGLIGNVIE